MKDRIYFVVKINGSIAIDLNDDGSLRTFDTRSEADARAEEIVLAGKGEYACCIAETTEFRPYEAKVGRVPLRVPNDVRPPIKSDDKIEEKGEEKPE